MIKRIFPLIFTLLLICSAFSTPINNFNLTTLQSNLTNKNSLISINTDESMLKILYPRSAKPEIKMNDDPFIIAVNTTLSINDWSFEIVSIFGSFPLKIINQSIENSIWIFYVKSENATTGLYNLTVIANADSTMYMDEEPRAVSIVDTYSDTFNFIIINDIRLSPYFPIREMAFRDAIQQVNMIHPTFVLIIGDLVNSDGESEKQTAAEYLTFYNLLQTFEVPTFVISGNHEYYNNGKKYYDQYLGYWPNTLSDDQYHNYSFTFGDSLFVVADTGLGGTLVDLKQSQIDWIESSFNNSNAKLKFLVMHVPVFDGLGSDEKRLSDSSQQEIIRIVDTYNVSLVLEGHTHIDKKTIYNNHIYLETTSLGAPARMADEIPNYKPHWGYRIIEIVNNTITSFSYDEPFGYLSVPVYIDENGDPTDSLATPLFDISYDYTEPGNYQSTATIQSHYKDTIPLWLKFVFPALPPNSSVFVNGSKKYIWTEFENKTYLYALVNASQDETITINAGISVPWTPTIHNVDYEIKEGNSSKYIHVIVNVTDDVDLYGVFLYYITSDNNSTLNTISLNLTGSFWIGDTEKFNTTTNATFWVVAVNIYDVRSVSENYTLNIVISQSHSSTTIDQFYIEVVFVLLVIIMIGLFVLLKKKHNLRKN